MVDWQDRALIAAIDEYLTSVTAPPRRPVKHFVVNGLTLCGKRGHNPRYDLDEVSCRRCLELAGRLPAQEDCHG